MMSVLYRSSGSGRMTEVKSSLICQRSTSVMRYTPTWNISRLTYWEGVGGCAWQRLLRAVCCAGFCPLLGLAGWFLGGPRILRAALCW